MNFLLPILLLAAPAGTPTDHRFAGSVEVFASDFEGKHDANYDYWPDGWTRRRGLGYPPYLKVTIAPPYNQKPKENRWLQLELDGGAIQINSPRIDINPKFDYVLEGRVRTERLQHNIAYVTVVLTDDQHNMIESFTSPHFHDEEEWRTFRVGPFSSVSGKGVRAVVQLHLRQMEKADLKGIAMFDDLRLMKLPHLRMQSNNPFSIYTVGDPVEVSGAVSTLREGAVDVEFAVIDADGNQVETQRQTTADTFSWEPSPREKGFYRLRASVRISDDLKLEREVGFAVVDSIKAPVRGEFGWSLPRNSHSIPLKLLPDLAARAAVNWVKVPIWKEVDDPEKANQIGWLAERLRMRGIQLVGMMDVPPEDVRSQFRNSGSLSIGEIFSDASVWPKAIDAVMSQMSLYVHWWQLGGDDDDSFADLTEVDKLFRQAQQRVGQFGTNLRLGLVWPWNQETPSNKNASWDFLARTEDIPLTHQELPAYLNDEKAHPVARQWVMLEPLPRDRYNTVTRAGDLVARMMAAKIGKSEGIFLRNPFHSMNGLMTTDGSPTELFLPWRTTSLILTGAKHLGSIRLPNGSQSQLFSRGEEVTLVVWNDRTTKERLFLGNEVSQTDVWGRATRLPDLVDEKGTEQEFEAGPLPIFITGLDPFVAQWRLAFRIKNPRLEIAPGRVQDVHYRMVNPSEQVVFGTTTFQLPTSWRVGGRRSDVKVGPRNELERTLKVQLGSEANSGSYPVRIDCDLMAARNYRFGVYDTLHVGFGNLEIQMTSHLDENGSLIVEQSFINQTEKPVSFNCELFVPNRSREQKTIRNLGPGEAINVFSIPQGRELLGQMLWLRASEINGDRVLNAEAEAVE